MKKSIWDNGSMRDRDGILLLFLCLVLVPVGIEYAFHAWLLHMLQDELYAGTITGFVMAVVFVMGVYYIVLRPNRIGWSNVGMSAFSKQYWKWIVFWILAILTISTIIVIIMDLLQLGVENSKTTALTTDWNWFRFGVGILSAAVISPVYEEIFYRGFLYKWFRSKWGVAGGVLGSSIIFTIAHIPTYNTLLINFISGVVFCWTYEQSKSVIPAIIIHGAMNGIAIIVTSLMQ
ncbi:lysostaphin resistance A-like protein [Pontibacillus salicampi]|uniref:Lysostaphin resistance A-like protein n=1 Tax=Pontibacillus salicampi TaxID=1449801 RepID=A0ABV6LK21_9BACI